eukprot:scaffold521161_cov28-Prasinocladus_malaysianus.AAC.1
MAKRPHPEQPTKTNANRLLLKTTCTMRRMGFMTQKRQSPWPVRAEIWRNTLKRLKSGRFCTGIG